HRLTRPNQDFLLPYMESGDFIVVGATTENPYISVAPAIRSRGQILQLHALRPDDIVVGLKRALQDTAKGLGNYSAQIDESDLLFIAGAVNGDFRSALTALEVIVKSTQPSDEGKRIISRQD